MGNALLELMKSRPVTNRLMASSAPRYSDRILPGEELNVRGVLDAATNVPIAGDILSAGLAGYDALKGDYTSAAMNAVGVLPFIGGAGMIKSVGNLPKNAIYPDGYSEKIIRGMNKLPQSETWDAAGQVKKDMSAVVKPMTDGDYLVTGMVPWGRKNKPFYAVGDDPEELATYALNRLEKGDKSIASAAKRKDDASLLGQLKSEYGDVFSLGKSTQSKSQYITHNPSGTKIRISDHDLPLGYEQADVDLRIGTSVQDMLNAIRDVIGK